VAVAVVAVVLAVAAAVALCVFAAFLLWNEHKLMYYKLHICLG
jgi:hypothetical protein